MCMYVYHEVSQTRCGRTLRRTAFVLGSFERSIPLVSGGVRSFAVSRDLDLFIERRSDPPDENRVFSPCLESICEKTDRDIEMTSMDS